MHIQNQGAITRAAFRDLERVWRVVLRLGRKMPPISRSKLFSLAHRLHLKIKHRQFTPRPDDVFVVSFPRSGTTWMQMILGQLVSGGQMSPDALHTFSPPIDGPETPGWPYDHLPSPRVFKSHGYYGELPGLSGRTIYVLRDGRDVAVSLYHFRKLVYGFHEGFAEFFDKHFMPGKTHHDWFKHVSGWCSRSGRPDLLIIRYEDLSTDLEGCITRIARFCNIEVTRAQMPEILRRCSFEFMKENEQSLNPFPSGNRGPFIREGKMRQWEAYLTPEQNRRFEAKCQRKFASLGLWF